MNKTTIEWVRTYNEDGTSTEGYTVNPIRFRPHGSERTVTMCQHASPGCIHCYAENITRRFWPKDSLVNFHGYTAQGLNSGKFELDEKQLLSVLKIRNPAKIFWVDMSDAFQAGVTDEMLDYCFAVCALTPHLTHMFLTKRPERMLEYILRIKEFPSVLDNTAADMFSDPKFDEWHRINKPNYLKTLPLPNVMLGTSAENQKYFDERIGYLDKLAHMGWNTYLSLEPLIGPIDVEYPKSMYPDGAPMCCNGYECGCRGLPVEPPAFYGTKLVIVGGESGHGARPMQSEWAHKIRRACEQWKIPYFHKQNGCWVDAGHEEFGRAPAGRLLYCNSEGNILSEKERRIADEDSDVVTMKWVGRKRAGNTLYGKTYHEFPA